MVSLCAINGMSSLWTLDGMSSQIFHFISPSPQSNRSLYYDLPPSQQFWPPPHILCPSWWGGERGGGGAVNINPSRTPYSTVISVLPPTNMKASSATAYCAAPVVLSLRLLSGIAPPAPFPVSSVGSPISPTIKFPIVWWVQGIPADTGVAQYHLLTLSPQGRMWAHAEPYSISVWVEAQADIPTIRRGGTAEVLQICRGRHLSQSLHDTELQVYCVVEHRFLFTSPTARPCSNSRSIGFLASLLLWCWRIQPFRRQHQPLPSLHLFLKSPELCEGSWLHVLYVSCVAGV